MQLGRTVDAPRERVWAAWTEPDKLRRWWGPERYTVPHCEMDVRPGGRWRTCMRSPEGSEHWVSGTYREIAPPERLAFTWAWEEDGPSADRPGTRGPETLVMVELHDRGAGRTEVVLTHADFETEEGRDNHETGWTSSLVCLEDSLRDKEG